MMLWTKILKKQVVEEEKNIKKAPVGEAKRSKKSGNIKFDWKFQCFVGRLAMRSENKLHYAC